MAHLPVLGLRGGRGLLELGPLCGDVRRLIGLLVVFGGVEAEHRDGLVALTDVTQLAEPEGLLRPVRVLGGGSNVLLTGRVHGTVMLASRFQPL